MNLFIDNCLAPKQARAWHSLYESDGHRIVHLRDEFPADEDDEEWIPRLDAQGGWCALTRDNGIRRKPRQRALWQGRSLIVFFLPDAWFHLRIGELHGRLSGAMDELIAVALVARPGTGYLLRVSGKPARLFDGFPKR